MVPSLAVAGVLAIAACVVRTSGGGATGPDPAELGPPPAGEPPPPAEATEATIEEVRDDGGRVYRISQGARGAPAEVGCADGQREAFVDGARYGRIAGCLGQWGGRPSMRAAATGAPCGDDGGGCAVPADLCAPGWHLCGDQGRLADLTQVSAEACAGAGGGRFSAAISHCQAQEGCAYDTRPDAVYACFPSGWCSESVCCGADCAELGACPDGVWPGATHIAQGTDQGCGAVSSQRAGGVLCCR